MEEKEKEKKWLPAHEVLAELAGKEEYIQTIAKAYAMGTAAPPEGIPGLIEAFRKAKSTIIGNVTSVRNNINMSIQNLKEQLAEAKAEEKKRKVSLF